MISVSVNKGVFFASAFASENSNPKVIKHAEWILNLSRGFFQLKCREECE